MVEKVEEERKLFAARMVTYPIVSAQPSMDLHEEDGNVVKEIDKMVVPKGWHKQVSFCRFFYKHDGMAYTSINKQVEIGINGYEISRGDCTDNEFAVYESLNPMIEAFLRDAALEFLISGLIIPEATWEKVRGMSIKTNLRKTYDLPTDLWYRDPLSIRLEKTPLPNRVITLVEASDRDIEFIMEKGKIGNFVDKETYKLLVRNYKDFVSQIQKGDKVFMLKDPFLIRRFKRSGTPYPTPYLLAALELFMHKRNLRKMDYSIAARVISAIQLFRLGSDDYPLTEDDDDTVVALQAQMRWRGLDYNIERIFQLFSNHTLQIDWIMPDTKALLDEGKYRSINEDIGVALGLPRVFTAGEAMRSGATNTSISILPSTNTIEAMREQLLDFPKELYRRVKERNSFRSVPEPHYPPIRLQDLKTLMDIGQKLYEARVLSRTDLAEMLHFDFDTSLERIAEETKKMKEMGIDQFAPVPFSPQPGPDGNNKPEEK